MGSRRGSHYDADGFVDAIRKQIYVNVEEKESDSRGGRGGRGGKGGSAQFVMNVRLLPPSFFSFSTYHCWLSSAHVLLKRRKHTRTLALTVLMTMTIVLEMVVTLTGQG